MIVHTGLAIVWQMGLWFATGNWWLGVAASLLFLGREHAQAEYRYIEHHAGGLRGNMPWYGSFTAKAWDRKALLDWIVPLVATAAIALLRGAGI